MHGSEVTTVVCACADYSAAAERQFTAAKAAKELDAYRKGRLGPTTRALRDALVDAGLHHGSLLDIGGGIGALTFELLARGVDRATLIDASPAYAAAADEEAARRGQSRTTTIVCADVMQLRDPLPHADLVALDRVVCCYPTYEPLLELAARHTARALALSYPRDRWFVRMAMWLENVRRSRTTGFRTYVHAPQRMQRVIERAGFALQRRRTTPMWSIDVYVRRS